MVRHGDGGLIHLGLIASGTMDIVRHAGMLAEYPGIRIVLRATDLRELGPRRIPADVYVVIVPDGDTSTLAEGSLLWERLPAGAGIAVVSGSDPTAALAAWEGPWGWALPETEPELLVEILYSVSAGLVAVDPAVFHTGDVERPAAGSALVSGRRSEGALGVPGDGRAEVRGDGPTDTNGASPGARGRADGRRGDGNPAVGRSDGHEVTPREREILALLSRGLANGEIATRLGISVNTVKFHLAGIYSRLGVSGRAEAVVEGIRAGILAL